MTKHKNARRVYAAIKTGFDSMMPPELLELCPDILTRPEYAPVTVSDYAERINAMFEMADRYRQECWIP